MLFWNRRKKAKPQYSSIHHAVDAGDAIAVEELLEYGADVDSQDGRRATPLHIASGCGYLEIAKILIDHCASVDFLIDEGGTPLMAACSKTRPHLVELLLSNGADPNKKGLNGRSPLKCVFQPNVIRVEDQLICIQLLAKHGAIVDAAADDGTTPLMSAAWFGNREGVEALLSLGANSSLRDSRGRTAAMLAFERRFDELAILLKKRSDC